MWVEEVMVALCDVTVSAGSSLPLRVMTFLETVTFNCFYYLKPWLLKVSRSLLAAEEPALCWSRSLLFSSLRALMFLLRCLEAEFVVFLLGKNDQWSMKQYTHELGRKRKRRMNHYIQYDPWLESVVMATGLKVLEKEVCVLLRPSLVT